MALRSTFKVVLSLGMLRVPVKGFSANNWGTRIGLHTLHKKCNTRVKMPQRCPSCDVVPDKDDKVKGYEFAKEQYVLIDEDELSKLRPENADKTMQVSGFFNPKDLDSRFVSDTSYVIAPDGDGSQGPYALIREALKKRKQIGFVKLILKGKEQIAVIRPLNDLLVVSVLRYEHELKDLGQFDGLVSNVEVGDEELALVNTLMDGMTDKKFSIGDYKDEYHELLTKLIDSKVSGKEIVATVNTSTDVPATINMMDALKASVAKVSSGKKVTKKKASKKVSKKKVAKKSKAKVEKVG